jgi:uncharacterized protein VirK/YbjX
MAKVSFYGKGYVLSIDRVFADMRLKKIIAANPKQYEKIFRPYLYKGLVLSERLPYIESHYEFTKRHWNDLFIEAVYCDRWFPLSTIVFDEDESKPYTIALSRESTFANEGEIFIGIFDPSGSKLISISFNFANNGEDNGIFIGSMQGSGSESAKDSVRDFTKKMEGMRPHSLILFALSHIAQFYNLHFITAINSLHHVRNERIKTDYDSFWEDAGGVRMDDRFYSIPVVFERKPIESVKSNKRAMYRRRYELLDSVAAQIENTLKSYSL